MLGPQHYSAHVQIWGKGQLKSFLDQLFEHILETELSGKLIIAPKLDMSHYSGENPIIILVSKLS